MKKIISILAVCALVLTSFVCVNAAATVNYTYTLSSPIADDTTGDLAYPVIVTANGLNPAGGYITLEWDSTKVIPAICYEDRRNGMVVDTARLPDDWADFVVSGDNIETIYEPDDAKSYLDTTNNKLAATWYTSKSTSDGEVIATFYFILADGVTTDKFDENTFKVVSDYSAWSNIKSYAKLDGKDDSSYTGAAIDCIFNTYTKGADPIAATKVVLDKTEATINTIGETVTLTAKVYGADDVEATNQNVTWSTSDDKVATVANGVVTAVADGTATITATSEDGNFTATCAITVDADWEAGAPADKSAWKDELKTNVDITSKKLVIFGKNSTTTALAAESYGVKIGNNVYPGKAPVPAGSSWAIVIYDANGNQVAKESYDYKLFINNNPEAPVSNGTVIAE